jgi:hypothetical protein
MPLITCPECKKEISGEAASCPSCGYVLKKPRKWNPGLAAVFSLIIPGAGQIYKGKLGAGFLWLIFVTGGYFLFLIPGIVLHLACIFSAYSGDPTK